MSDLAREIRHALTDAEAVCRNLGFIGGRGTYARQGAYGVLMRCPWHEDSSPSCSVRRAKDGTLSVRCFACDATGDVLDLVAKANGLSVKTDFRRVLLAAAELAGLWQVVAELEGRAEPADRPAFVPPPPAPERDYPPRGEVDALWALAVPVTDDAQATTWLRSRALEPDVIADQDLVRVVPSRSQVPPWATFAGRSWLQTGHRMLVPMRDADGDVRSVRAVRIVDGDSPKRLPPTGHKAAGLVMADALAVALLSGTAQPRRLVVVEGEPDWLTWATRRHRVPTAVIGIVSGGWTAAHARKVLAGTEVIIRTDHDAAGEKYARDVERTLGFRCFVSRSRRMAADAQGS